MYLSTSKYRFFFSGYGTYSTFHLLDLQRNRTEARLLVCNTRAISLSQNTTIRCIKLECLDFKTRLQKSQRKISIKIHDRMFVPEILSSSLPSSLVRTMNATLTKMKRSQGKKQKTIQAVDF